MKQKRVWFSVLLVLFVAINAFTQVTEVVDRPQGKVIKGQLIAKIKSEYRVFFFRRDYSESVIQDLLSMFDVQSIERKFFNSVAPRHSKNSHGEKLVDLSRVYTIYFNENFNEFEIDINILKNDLIKKLEKLIGKKKNFENIFIDKSLENFFYIDVILKIFPSAKIINTFRDPRHSVIAIFQQMFKQISWSHRIQDILEYIDFYLKVINFFKSKYPNQIFSVNLEKLSLNPKNILKELFNFCNLKWQDDYLNFYKNENIISRTASNIQIRQKIYKYDKDKFKNYKFVFEKYKNEYSWLKDISYH